RPRRDAMMSISTRRATLADFDAIIPLMRGYYRDDHLEFDLARPRRDTGTPAARTAVGCVVPLESQGACIGYAAICIGFSLELGGNDAFVDEVFVAPDH